MGFWNAGYDKRGFHGQSFGSIKHFLAKFGWKATHSRFTSSIAQDNEEQLSAMPVLRTHPRRVTSSPRWQLNVF